MFGEMYMSAQVATGSNLVATKYSISSLLEYLYWNTNE